MTPLFTKTERVEKQGKLCYINETYKQLGVF